MSSPTVSTRAATAIGAVAGLVAAAVALGIAELVSGLRRGWRSPVLDVGDRVVDRVPPFVKDFAIETFGTNDKLALLIGIGAFLAVYAAAIGAVAFRRRISVGVVGIAVFGLIGAYAALTRRVGGSFTDVAPSVIGAALGAGALWLTHRALRPVLPTAHRSTTASAAAAPISDAERTADTEGIVDTRVTADANAVATNSDAHSPPASDRGRGRGRAGFEGAGPARQRPVEALDKKRAGMPRRQVLAQGGGLLAVLAVAGAGAGALGRSLKSRFSAAESRAALRLPPAGDPLPPIPGGVAVGVDGMAPFFTPNADFYRIDTALTVPQLSTDDYELRVTGLVDRELRFSFEDLLARDVVEHDITLTCVSNTVGGELVGNARWLGVRLDELLAEAGVQAGADQVVGRSIDGYTCGFPLEAATDGRNAMVAFGMNGEPLPLEHGFPARLVVPGLYGYVSATKWLVEIELTTFDEFDQYWVPRGYAEQAPIKLMSRIDTVDGLGTVTRDINGVAAVGGVAWAQTRGIGAVEVQVDDGDWTTAELGEALNDDTWRQWAYRWTPTAAGRSTIRCRAIDREGVIQTAERSEPLPDGAAGHHQIVVFVE